MLFFAHGKTARSDRLAKNLRLALALAKRRRLKACAFFAHGKTARADRQVKNLRLVLTLAKRRWLKACAFFIREKMLAQFIRIP